MALHYVLDGYNVIRQTSWLSRGSLEDTRRALVRFCLDQRPQGSRNNDVTIVFDGQGGLGGWGDQEGAPGVRVLFSSSTNADERIKQLVGEDAHPKTLVVVTEDREIRYFVRSLGARVLGVAAFLGQARTGQTASAETPSVEPEPLPPSMKATITEELSRLWLKKRPKG